MPKPEQLPINFSGNTIETINIFHESSQKDTVDGRNGVNVQFPEMAKHALLHLFKGVNIPASKGVREMVEDYIDLFPHREKFRRHKKFLIAMMQRLS